MKILEQFFKFFHLECLSFSFDLKSAYHHIDICEEHMKSLSFKWPSVDGEMKFYEFKVLPFGVTSAPCAFLLKLCAS